ncbi:hypothetical protein [Halorientalis marina]|jgi:hypothetical protein|uniref:hypothetical protein n=1 Tax=Halorientalis marina TaxID=2931976 RepID=UPI001FF6DD47|nr:hypothetical protein [Halorientalis marina]
MLRDRSAAALAALPEAYVYPVLIVVLTVGTAAALATNRDLLGVVGVVALSVVSLAYGAMQRPEDF